MVALSVGILTTLASVTGCGSGSSTTSSTSNSGGASANTAQNSSSGSASAGATINMRIGDTSSSISIPGQAVQKFADLVNKYSNGHIKAQVFPNGQLGPFDQEATQLKTNSINAMFIQPDALGTHVKLAQVDAWPFMFHTPEEMVNAWNAPGGKKVIEEIEKESGYLLAAPTWNSPRYIFVNKLVNNLIEAQTLEQGAQ
jgi:TRAP-type transport system periplasmic protein